MLISCGVPILGLLIWFSGIWQLSDTLASAWGSASFGALGILGDWHAFLWRHSQNVTPYFGLQL